MSNNPFNAGPPDPINFLRTVSGQDVRDTSGNKRRRDDDEPPATPSRREEAPARERPPPGESWPYRVSFRKLLTLLFDPYPRFFFKN